MNARASWVQEFWRIALLIAMAWIVGSVFDQVLMFLLLAMLAYGFRSLFNLQRLSNWLSDPEPGKVPINFGLWGDIYSRISRISRHQAQREKRLTSMLNEYTSSTSALPDVAIALDAEGRIRWFNQAASRLVGLQPAKDIGQPLVNLFRAPEMIEFCKRRDYGSTLQTTAPGNSARCLEVRLTPYGEGQTLLLAQDVTERLQHERMRKDFVANVSHELKTPLTVIRGFLENFQADGDIDKKLAKPLDLMAQQASRMQQIIEDLLLLARLENAASPSRIVPVDMRKLTDEVVTECLTLGSHVPKIEITIDSHREVLGDEQQLRSALTNLVVNAVHHTPEDGKIDLSWQDAGSESLLEVTDTGEGISSEHIPRLTERFYRVDTGRSRDRGGTGLGLAIVKHIINRHDGRLEIESRLGAGSRFRCRFPASRLRS